MADHPTLTDAERTDLLAEIAAAILGRTATDAAARVVPIVERILAARTASPDAQPDGLADRVRALAETPARTLMPDPDDLPVGTPVLAWPGSRDGSALVTVTRSLPWRLPAGDVVVQVLPLALLGDAGEREGDGRG